VKKVYNGQERSYLLLRDDGLVLRRPVTGEYAARRKKMGDSVSDIKVRLRTEADLREFVDLYAKRTGFEPCEIDPASLLVHVSDFSDEDMAVFGEFLVRKGGQIITDEVFYDD
jgi:hypothetical protein